MHPRDHKLASDHQLRLLGANRRRHTHGRRQHEFLDHQFTSTTTTSEFTSTTPTGQFTDDAEHTRFVSSGAGGVQRAHVGTNIFGRIH